MKANSFAFNASEMQRFLTRLAFDAAALVDYARLENQQNSDDGSKFLGTAILFVAALGLIYLMAVTFRSNILDERYLFGLSLEAATVPSLLILSISRLRQWRWALGLYPFAIFPAYLGLANLDVDLDNDPGVTQVATIVSEYSSSSRHGTSYYIDVAMTDGATRRIYSLYVGGGLYGSSRNSSKLRITINTGALSARWISDITPL